MAPTAFSGSLQSKKKAELLEIALALQISDRGTKEEVQARIKKRLDDNPHLKDNPAFSGLLGRGKRSMQPQLLSHSAPSSVSQSLTGVEVPKTPDIQLPIAPEWPHPVSGLPTPKRLQQPVPQVRMLWLWGQAAWCQQRPTCLTSLQCGNAVERTPHTLLKPGLISYQPIIC
ncbi:hypothetical protein J3A83DRAFT_4185970 [Scleroderma citrinum]